MSVRTMPFIEYELVGRPRARRYPVQLAINPSKLPNASLSLSAAPASATASGAVAAAAAAVVAVGVGTGPV